MGGDATAGVLNPAGYGFYNRSSISITPSFQNIGTTTRYENGPEVEDFTTNFGVANFGLVISNTKDNPTGRFRGGAFAVTYNRTNFFDYNNDYAVGESFGSLPADLAERASSLDPPVFPADFQAEIDDRIFVDYLTGAYNNRLIVPTLDENGPTGEYFQAIPDSTLSTASGTATAEGRLGQWNFSYGANFDDKLYLGASIGFMSFSQERTNSFLENYIYPQRYVNEINSGAIFFPAPGNSLSVDFVENVRLEEQQQISGTGINANLGVIYRPIQNLTIGVSFLTPTIYGVEEESSYILSSSISGLQEDENAPFQERFSAESVQSPATFSYNLKTPARLGVGASYFFEKYGFLSADVEYVNYAGYRFSSGEPNSTDLVRFINDDIDQVYSGAINYRLGGEFRYDAFRLRLGYAMFADPTSFENDVLDRDRQSFSGGIGVVTSSFFADLAATYSTFDTDAEIYQGGGFYTQSNNLTNIALTVGFNF